MEMNFTEALAAVRASLITAAHPDPLQRGRDWNTYETARLATEWAGRPPTIAYVLGIAAGLRFCDSNDVVPGNPFGAGTAEAKDYADGIKHAVGVEVNATRLYAKAFGGA